MKFVLNNVKYIRQCSERNICLRGNRTQEKTLRKTDLSNRMIVICKFNLIITYIILYRYNNIGKYNFIPKQSM